MLRVERQYFPPCEGQRRAEVVCSVVGACDICGAQSDASREYDGDTYWSQSMAHLHAVSAGYVERMSGRIQQLICPKCQETSHA